MSTPPSLLDFVLDDLSITSGLTDNGAATTLTPPDEDSLLTDVELVTDKRKLIRAGILTVFPPDQDPKWLLPTTYFANTIGLLNWCGQFELAPETQTLHCHLYMEWAHKQPKRFEYIRKAICDATGKNGDVRKTKRITNESRRCAANYCLKPDTWVTGEDTRFIWPHNKHPLKFDQKLYDQRREKKSSKESKEEVDERRRLHIETKPKHWTWDQILHESEESKQLLCTCSWGKKYHEGRHAETPRRTIKNVIILYGAGGTGKTTLAKNWDSTDGEDIQERYYRRNPDDGAFWGGGRTAYKGQRIIHLEEFCGQESLSRFKEIADIGSFGPNVNVKNGGQELNHDTLIITSNHHPAAWFRGVWSSDPKQFHPFWRRITQVWYFPSHKEDGTLNMPNNDDEYYYIDQTDDWQSFKGDYQQAVDHATTHWPIKELTDGGDADSPNFNNPSRKRARDPDAMEIYCRTGKYPKDN